jgi:hypothetical protein
MITTGAGEVTQERVGKVVGVSDRLDAALGCRGDFLKAPAEPPGRPVV